MKTLNLAILVNLVLFVASPTAEAQVFAESGGIELVFIPQPSPGEGYSAGIVQARAIDPTSVIVTYRALSFNNVHQVWSPGNLQAAGGTAKGIPLSTPFYPEAWIPFDSHLLISPDMAVGGGGGEYVGITESNDGDSHASALLPKVTDDNLAALTGYGNISMDQLTDAFFVDREFQQSVMDLAYLVAPDDPSHRVEMSLGFSGLGFGDPEFGFHEARLGEIDYAPIRVPFGNLATRVGAITGPTTMSTSFGNVELDWRTEADYLPISVAAPPNEDAIYSVELTGVTEISDDGGLFEFSGRLGTSIPAGATRGIGPFVFAPSTIGDWTADYQLSFNDGTTIDATFAASVFSGMNNGGGDNGGGDNGGGNQGGGNQGGGQSGDFEWYLDAGQAQPGGWTNGEVRHVDGATVLAEFGGIQIVSVPQPSPGDGFTATRIELWTVDPADAVVTLAGLAITGTHQVWLDGPFGTSTPVVPDSDTFYPESWIELDSHLLVSTDDIGGGAGGGFSSIGETNDGSTTVGETLPAAVGFPAESGIGPIAMDSAFGAFFLDPEAQANKVELAYVVFPENSSESVDLYLEVLGGSDVNAAFGFHGNEPVRIFAGVPEPGGAMLAVVALLALGIKRRHH